MPTIRLAERGPNVNCSSCTRELSAPDVTRTTADRSCRRPVVRLLALPGLFISLFLPWSRASIGVIGEDFDALAHGYMYMPLVLSLVELGYLVLIAGLP